MRYRQDNNGKLKIRPILSILSTCTVYTMRFYTFLIIFAHFHAKSDAIFDCQSIWPLIQSFADWHQLEYVTINSESVIDVKCILTLRKKLGDKYIAISNHHYFLKQSPKRKAFPTLNVGFGLDNVNGTLSQMPEEFVDDFWLFFVQDEMVKWKEYLELLPLNLLSQVYVANHNEDGKSK